jgi:hypothetical protein
VGGALENPLAFLLRHATQDSEHLAVAEVTLKVPEPRKDLLFRPIADTASVIQHQVSRFRSFDSGIAPSDERADHFFRIVRVHLAAERLDIKGFRGHHLSF